MGWQDVYRKYDEQGNVVDELRFNLGSPEYEEAKKARESGGGKVGDWYIKSGTGDITKKTNIFDEATRIADFYTPKIGVNEAGNGLVITGPSTAINNDMTKQLQSYLDDTFKYADLKSANVADAIEKLNQDVYSQIEQRITDNMLKVPYNEYKEYKEMLQQFQGTNPLKSTSAVPGYTKDGRKISVADDDKKTIAQWLKYYEEHYSAKERAELFMKSMEALMSGDTDFAKYTPYLVMSGGKGSSPVYGFNAGERAAAGIETIYNETVGKLFEGAAQIAMQLSNPFSWQGYGRRNNLNEIAHSLGHSEDVDPAEVKWMSEKAFNEKRDSLIGKNIDELTSDEQAFLAALTGDKLTGYFFGAGRPNPKDFLTEEGDSKLIDANQINQFSYEDYTNARDNLSTISKYSKEITEGVETPFRGIREDIDVATLYAPIEVGTANFIGTMMRFWIESGLISLATGGTVNPMALSDKFAEGISKILTKSGLVTNPETLSTGLGNFLLRVGAEIPEDIVQTAIDDVLTAHVDEVGTLLTPDSIADNTMQNLVMRLAFTPVTSLWSWARNKKAIQDAAKAAGMEEKAPESLFTNAQKVKQAADGLPGAGTIVDVTPNSATIRMADGTEEVVDNVAMLHFADGNMQERYPQMYEILRKKGLTNDIETDAGAVERRMDFARKMAEDEYGGDITYTVKEGALPDDFYAKGATRYIPDNYEYDSIIERKIPRDEQFSWYIGRDGEYDVAAKKSMFEKAKADPELRNAALNKMFNEWKSANPGNNNMDFNDWLNTEITLYHGDSTFDIPNDGSGAVEYSLRESVARMFGDKISELKIRPEDTTGVLRSDWTADGIEGEGEVFVPYQLVDSAKLDSGDFSTGPQWKPISDIVTAKNKAASYLAGEAPSSGSYSWESPDVPKTYNSEEEVFADRPVGKSMTDIRQWQKNAEAFYMNKYRDEALPKFTEKYPTVDEQQQFVRNMDYLFEVQRRGGADLVVSPKMENVEELSFTKYQVPKSYINNQGEIDLSRRPLAPFERDIFKENKAIRSSDYKKYYKDVEKVFDKWDSDAGKTLDVADRSNVSLEDSENYRTAMADAMAKNPLPEVPESLLNSEAYRNAKLNISSLVDSSPLVDFYTMQNDTLGAIRRELRNTGYDNLSPEMKARVDAVDNNISQKLENDMVLYRGETMSDYADSLKTGDQIDSAAWTFASPFEGVTTEYRMGETTAKKNKLDGGVLYRYHTKSGQPAYFAPGSAITDTANDEIMLPRNINGTVTKVTDNKAGKVFGKFVPRKIVDVDVDISGVANGQKVNWGEGNTVIDRIYAEDVPSPKTSTPSTEPEYTISGSAIGRTYENEGITYTVNEDDVRFYLDNVEPLMSGLREAGAAGIGQDPFTITGYLPHSDYDPTLLTAEDSMQQGVLWRENTGKSTTAEDGSFSTGWLSPDLETRYRTFVNNMLWDSLGNEVVVAKFMEELHADGIDVDIDKVIRLVGGRENLAKIVSKSDSAKAVIKGIIGDGKIPSNSEIEGAAKKAGATDAIHEIYSPIYGTSGKPNQRLNVSLMSKSDWMRSLTTGDGSLYDNGGTLIVNSGAEAKYMAKRIFEAVEKGEQLDTHGMFIDFLTQNNRRTNNGASYIADRWMDKIAQKCMDGGITRRELTAELSRLIYNEGVNRLFRFVGRMDTSQLNESNRQALDSLIFRHSMLSKVMNTSGITAKLNKAANALISARMKSLFWLNFKNGVLQASECIRIFTEFKLGDARKTIKRLATDAEFRAEADEWVDMFVPDRFVKSDSSASIGALDTIMDNTTYDANGMTVNKLSAADLKKVGKDFDTFMSKPVEMGEALKNRVLMAGILEEAERKGLSGNEKFSYVAKRFERIGLAANEMGRLNASDNPFFRIASNLKTFQIRQFRMYMNNIADMNGPKEKVTYILKNLGWKAGLAVVMAKLGYSAAATLGFDPFDLMDDDYTGVDEEDYTGLDYVVLSPVGKLFLSGGFTGYINDLYWAGRKTYEDNAEITEQTEERLNNNFWPGWVAPGTDFDNALNTIGGFIPGYTAGKRVVQMNELMDTGWATSKSGTKMYQAPTNPLEVLSGYVFGRSNTPNARAYYQTPDYLQGLMSGGIAGLGQQISREMKPLRQLFGDTNAGFREFDPIDSQNYTDWFNGTAADEQQWQSGYYYFLNKVQDMQNEYQQSLQSYTTDEQKASLQQSFNERMQDVEDQLERFTKAYESKHPEGIDAKKTKNLINILNLYQPVMTDTEEEANERSLDAYGQALYRYSQAGLPATTFYKRNDSGEVEEVYSPQLRSALQGEFGLPEEAAAQIRKLYNDKWKDLGKQYRDRLFATKGTKAKQAIQNEYIDIVRQDLDPIVRNYGANIFSNEDVENIIDDVFNSMIPKYGQSAKSYLKNLYKGWSGTVRYTERGNQTLTQINKLLDEGKTAQAKSLARSLLQRVQENRTSLTRAELERLQKILND